MRALLSNWRILLFLAALALAVFLVAVQGPQYGLEFTGGTYFQIKLENQLPADDMERVVSLIGRRIDAFGLRDSRVNSMGDDLVGAQIAETNPDKIAELEALIRTQAKFEAMMDGNVLFLGSDLKQISKDPSAGYGISEVQGGVEWRLPFVLSQSAAEKFSKGIFHKCTAVGFEGSKTKYDCAKTYFFIDRPSDGVIIIPRDVYASDSELMPKGNPSESIPEGLTVEELMRNAGLPFIVLDSNGLTQAQTAQLQSLASAAKRAIVPAGSPKELTDTLASLGYKISEVGAAQGIPWTWMASGARQAIEVTPEIAGLEPYIENVNNATIYSSLYIRGYAIDMKAGQADLRNLQILLETGSLPIGIESVSRETISPSLGKDFLTTTVIIGIAAIVAVSLLIFLRYRRLYLSLPVIFVGISEVTITAGVAILLGIRFDLASVTGIIAAVGTGLNDQIEPLENVLAAHPGVQIPDFMGIPLPLQCFECRHLARFKLRNPRKLWNRPCMKCGKEMETTYQPSRPEIVYCEPCYLAEVY